MTSPKLKAHVLKSILKLNSYLPDESASTWRTKDEIRQILVHCGVHKSLSVEMVQKALTRINRGDKFMSKRPEGHESFFRPSIYQHDDGAPLDQRVHFSGHSKRLPNLPERDYLKTHVAASQQLKYVNSALKDLVYEINEEKEKECKKKRGRFPKTKIRGGTMAAVLKMRMGGM